MHALGEQRRIVTERVSRRLPGIGDFPRAQQRFALRPEFSLLEQIGAITVTPAANSSYAAGLGRNSPSRSDAHNPDFPSPSTQSTT